MRSLAALRWTDVGARPGLLVVPVGATEQHGPHLPLTVDTEIATALAERLAARRPEAVVAPAIAYGSSGEHQGFPGTLSIGQAATELLLVELGRSATETFDRVLLVSAHGGNAGPVNAAVRRLRDEGRDVRAWAPSWREDAHAGRAETSVMLALAPERIRMEAAEVGQTRPLAELLPALRDGGVRAVSDTGVLGDPTGATAEHGRALLAQADDDLDALVEAWAPAAGSPGAAARAVGSPVVDSPGAGSPAAGAAPES